jgi:colanic acid/amylovoran biosynthesis glycosyltransferase
MRVCLVVQSFPKASETFLVNKFLGLRERGWDVHVVCASSAEAEWQRFARLAEDPSIRGRVHKAWPSRPRWLAAALTVPSLFVTTLRSTRGTCRYVTRGFRRFGVDVFRRLYLDAAIVAVKADLIHFEFGALAADRVYLGDLLGAKTVVSFRGYDLNLSGLDDDQWYEGVWRDADRLHLLGHDLWRQARRRGCPSDKFHTLISPAIDSEFFDPGERTPAPVVGTSERPLRVLSVGRLDWRKGYEYSMAAVAQLEASGVCCEYRIVGEGEYLEPVAFARHQFGLDDVVDLRGVADRDEVRRHLRWADVYLHAAVSEGFCNSVVEAQAMALPVVCSDAGGLPENVVDGVTGFVVPRRTVAPIAEALERLARSPDLRRTLGEAGRRRAVERFNLADQIAAFERLYRETLGAEESPDRRAEPECVIGVAQHPK